MSAPLGFAYEDDGPMFGDDYSWYAELFFAGLLLVSLTFLCIFGMLLEIIESVWFRLSPKMHDKDEH